MSDSMYPTNDRGCLKLAPSFRGKQIHVDVVLKNAFKFSQ